MITSGLPLVHLTFSDHIGGWCWCYRWSNIPPLEHNGKLGNCGAQVGITSTNVSVHLGTLLSRLVIDGAHNTQWQCKKWVCYGPQGIFSLPLPCLIIFVIKLTSRDLKSWRMKLLKGIVRPTNMLWGLWHCQIRSHWHKQVVYQWFLIVPETICNIHLSTLGPLLLPISSPMDQTLGKCAHHTLDLLSLLNTYIWSGRI